jgi:LmbE family N-acetylglucosaminyl deacetylase
VSQRKRQRMLALLAFATMVAASPAISATPKAVRKTIAAAPVEDVCVGSRVLSVVAHADDDLYFINPSIDAAIARGACVHTVVVTGGYVDNPDNSLRLAGLKAAYAAMTQRNEVVWREEWLTLAGKPVQRWTLAGSPKVVLSFLHLPCGSHDDVRPRQPARLYELYTARDRTETIGPQAGVPYDQVALVAVLQSLIREWDPDAVYTLQPHRKFPVRHSRPGGEGAHPDHVIVSRLTLTALIGDTRVRVVRLHDDYPIQDLPANLTAEQAIRKTEILKTYCREDIRGCANPDTLAPACRAEDADGWGESWLCRHYPQKIPNRQ